MTPRIARLRAELASDLGAFRARTSELAAADPGASADAGTLARAAVAIHHAYGSIEGGFERIARNLEGGLPEGRDWHVALLESMALEIPRIRPPVISREALDFLRRLLAFRHFFRHAYSVDLDAARLADLRSVALALIPILSRDLAAFDEFLRLLETEGGRANS